MVAKTISEIRELSLPAELHTGASISHNCWPLALSMYELWKGKSADNKVAPDWRSLSPSEISEALPLVSIFDVNQVPFLLKCRLMGTAFAEAIGFDATGDDVRDIAGSEALMMRASWVVENIEPLMLVGLPLVWSPEKSYKTYDTLCLPFINKSNEVDTILYLNQFHAS
ncbi:MAG: hypothetical protein AB3N28_01480, partial [Kordiimonas sp.]